jgi:hypothetical protein
MAQATFDIQGDAQNAKKLCLLPGTYNTLDLVYNTTSQKYTLSYNNIANLNNAGYACDQVADDNNTDDPKQYVTVNGVNRTRFRDFLNTVQRVGAAVNKIIIQNKNTNSQDIFDQQIEVAKTVIGAKGGTDFITLQNYVSVDAYDRTKITIDLSGFDEFGRSNNLMLTPEVFLALNIPAGAHFSIQFQFNTTTGAIA